MTRSDLMKRSLFVLDGEPYIFVFGKLKRGKFKDRSKGAIITRQDKPAVFRKLSVRVKCFNQEPAGFYVK